MKKSGCFLAASLLLLFACTAEMQQDQAAESTHGAELLAPLKQELKSALVDGMQKGPLDAISVCKDQAPAIAASLSVEGVQMGRTSHRLRNPDNAAPEWVAGVLRDYLGQVEDRDPKLVHLQNGRLGYVEPIATQPLCLACHGESLAPELAAYIRGEYPDDEATGFNVGDLRGVFWVEYPEAQ